ncbi:MAG: basic amino acid/polyamine antiporter [Pseudomonadota bacterium]
MEEKNKLGLISLIAMCVGSMIGAGLFALPQNVALTTGPAALLIAWGVTLVGMLCLANVFQTLSNVRPDLDAGVYAYAKAGFGDYLGFCSAWGYWISAWIGNVGFVMMLCSALSFFFPIFGDGTNIYSIILSSALIWSITFLCIKGVKSAALVNNIATFAKIIPIIIFIGIVAYAFKKEVFLQDMWHIKDLGSIPNQISKMMLVTVWTFIGIEGASVFSARAKNRADVGKATIIGFLIVFVVLFLVSALPYGVLTQQKLATLNNPSTGAILLNVIGGTGNGIINIGLIISVIGALLAWILMAAEVPFVACQKDRLFPKIFGTENSAFAPRGALIITALCQQIYIIVASFYHAGYLMTILLSTSMILIPYLFSAIFAFKTALKNKSNVVDSKIKHLIIGFIAVIYGIWLLYAAGIKYLACSTILYFIGSIIFIINKRQRQERIFKAYEWALFLFCTIISISCLIKISYLS